MKNSFFEDMAASRYLKRPQYGTMIALIVAIAAVGISIYWFLYSFISVFLIIGGVIIIIGSVLARVYIGILVGLVMIAFNFQAMIWHYYISLLGSAVLFAVDGVIDVVKDLYNMAINLI